MTSSPHPAHRTRTLLCLGLLAAFIRPAWMAVPQPREPGLLFYLSADKGTTADFSAGGTPAPNFDYEVKVIPDGAKGPALQCGDLQRLAWWAPGNIYAQRGTLSFFWRSRYPVGPTAFPIFRVGFGDHSSWDMVWLRIDYNGHGFDASPMATGVRLKPMIMTMGPTTTGGSTRAIHLSPIIAMMTKTTM